MDATYPLRLGEGRREKLEEIGKPYHANKASLIRLAIDQLILATEENGGQLPEPIALRIKEEAEEGGYHVTPKPEAAAVASH